MSIMNVRGIQRNMKNVVRNYSDAQVKVREATSNDPWGPSSTLMSEIADLTYNVVAFSEIMQMVWKRLNDHGKNWRHVYKALVLLEYLIKTGSEKVAQQCKENIFAIQTLKDFQYIEEAKDQGLNVREKSKALVTLLKDDEKLRNERARALKAKERFAQSMSYAEAGPSDGSGAGGARSSLSFHEALASGGVQLGPDGKPVSVELESARPQTLGEEELQLQLALAMSKEEAEQEEKLRKNDDLRLQLALSESKKSDGTSVAAPPPPPVKKSNVDDLLSLAQPAGGADPWGSPLNGAASHPMDIIGAGSSGLSALNDPWSQPSTSSMPIDMAMGSSSHHRPQQQQQQPLASSLSGIEDPWAPKPSNSRSTSATNDPWQSTPPPMATQVTSNSTSVLDDDAWLSVSNHSGGASNMMNMSPETTSSMAQATRKTPENFLGPNSNLVNLDALVSTKTSAGMSSGGNPFATSSLGGSMAANPFQAAKPAAPSMNQLRSQQQNGQNGNTTSTNNNPFFM